MTARFEYVIYEVKDGIAFITLNRPEVLNACNPEMHAEIQLAVQDAESDDQVRVLLLRGNGRSFCAGSDIRAIRDFKDAQIRKYIHLDFSTKNRVASCMKPVIASLHGHVVGGGFELALSCDIRIAAQNTLFSLPEISLGTIPGSGGLQRLPQIVGLGLAKEWTFTGRQVDAQEAFACGLVNHVYPMETLESEAINLATVIAQKSSIALTLAKRALDPVVPSTDGLVGMYHMLASQACHDDPAYGANTKKYGR